MTRMLTDLNERLKARPKKVIWRCRDVDMPIIAVGVMGVGKDGRVYIKSESGTGIPLDEITGLHDQSY